MSDLKSLCCDQFSPLTGSNLVMTDAEGAALEVTVQGTTIHPHGSVRGAIRQSFSVFMRAPEPCAWGSGHYTLTHPELGAIGPVYVVRIVSDEPPGVAAAFQLGFN